MMTDDLVKELRRTPGWPTLGNAAADRIEELEAVLNQIPDYAYNAGVLRGILVGIVDWAYHQEDKPEWLDGAEGILREVKND